MDDMGSGSPVNDWSETLRYSQGQRAEADTDILLRLVPGAIRAEKASLEMDRAGIDYIITLRRGAQLYVDAKTRMPGCSRYWRRGEPEVAMEIWSVMPAGKFNVPMLKAKVGWSLCEKRNVDLILYTFHQSDSSFVYLFPFPHLRIAFRKNLERWGREYGRKIEVNHNGPLRWESEAIFVPASVVRKAIDQQTRHSGIPITFRTAP